MKNPLTKLLSNHQNKEIATGSIFSFFFKMTGIATTYSFTLIVTRFYGADVLGIFSISFTLLMLIAMLSKMGLDTAALRFIVQYNSIKNKEQIETVYWRSWQRIFIYSFIASITLYLLGPIIAKYIFKKTEIISSLKIISLVIVPMALSSLNQESLRAIKKIGYYSFFLTQSVFMFSAPLLLFICMGRHDSNKTAPIIAVSLGIVCTWILSQIVWYVHSESVGFWSARKIKSDISTEELLKVARPLLLANSMNFFMQWTDTLALGFFCSAESLGIYTTSVKIANFANIPYMVINSLAAPMIVEGYAVERRDGLRNLLKKLTCLMSFGAILCGGVLFLARYKALELFGSQFVVGVTALEILLLAKIGQAVAGPVALVMQMTGQERLFQQIMFLVVVTNIALNIVLVPLYGINGAAYATMSSVILMSILTKIATYVQLKPRH